MRATDMLDTYMAFFLGQKQVLMHRGLGFSGYLMCLQMLHLCKLQQVSEAKCVNAHPIEIHRQAALMVLLCVCLALSPVCGP